ncbi:hypothetical protein PIB30_097174, partial [Stylosanthes scabra]|nr:hypothetical protein [Stylosanthes scabra]
MIFFTTTKAPSKFPVSSDATEEQWSASAAYRCFVLDRQKRGPQVQVLGKGFKAGGFRRPELATAGGGPARPLRRS